MSLLSLSCVWESSKSTGNAKLVLIAIADFANDRGIALCSHHDIARKAKVSEDTVKRILKRLYNSGELRQIRPSSSGTPATYQIKVEGL